MVFAAANTSGPRATAASIHETSTGLSLFDVYISAYACRVGTRRRLFYPELTTWNTEPIHDMEWANCRSLHIFFFPIPASETPKEQDSIPCSQNTQLPPDKTDTISSQSYEPESLHVHVRNAKFQSQSRVSGIP